MPARKYVKPPSTKQLSKKLVDTSIAKAAGNVIHRATGYIRAGRIETKCGLFIEGSFVGGSVSTPSNCVGCGPAKNQPIMVRNLGEWCGYIPRVTTVANYAGYESRSQMDEAIARAFSHDGWREARA